VDFGATRVEVQNTKTAQQHVSLATWRSGTRKDLGCFDGESRYFALTLCFHNGFAGDVTYSGTLFGPDLKMSTVRLIDPQGRSASLPALENRWEHARSSSPWRQRFTLGSFPLWVSRMSVAKLEFELSDGTAGGLVTVLVEVPQGAREFLWRTPGDERPLVSDVSAVTFEDPRLSAMNAAAFGRSLASVFLSGGRMFDGSWIYGTREDTPCFDFDGAESRRPEEVFSFTLCSRKEGLIGAITLGREALDGEVKVLNVGMVDEDGNAEFVPVARNHYNSGSSRDWQTAQRVFFTLPHSSAPQAQRRIVRTSRLDLDGDPATVEIAVALPSEVLGRMGTFFSAEASPSP
jgi:hypothetical protein